MTREEEKQIIDIIHKTIYSFFDVCNDNGETPISDKDKLLLEVNKAICNNIKALEQEPVLDKIKIEIEYLRLHKAQFLTSDNKVCIDSQEVLNVIDKYRQEG